MRSTHAFAALLTAVLCTACADSPPLHYYTLVPMPFQPHDMSERNIGVGPILFPEYLQRPQIVTHVGVNQLRVAEYERWAEPIESEFLRTLSSNLDGLLPGYNVIDFPTAARLVDVELRIIGRVTRFDMSANGLAVLDVQWGVGNKGDTIQSITHTMRSQFTARATDPDDYSAVVSALNETLQAFSRTLAQQIEAGLD